MKSLAASLAAGLSVGTLIDYADGFTRIQNSLKVAGLEGQNLAAVQGRLLDLSSRYGVSLESLSDLFGNASQASKELGANQEQILAITSAVSQALLVTGKSSTEAAGAVQGLTQAFNKGMLQAEEFQQINEGGLRPLLQAAAATEKYGGSVAKLQKAAYDQKVTSQEFFNAILEGSHVLEDQASKATLTLAGAFEALKSRLTVYIGEADKANGASAALASAIGLLADNIDKVAGAIEAIALVMGAKYVAAAAQAVIASGAVSTAIFAIEARAIGAATTMEALALTGRAAGGTLLAAFGGPIGAAVLALGAGIYALTKYTEGAAKETDEYRAKVEDAAKADDTASNLALKLATARGAERQAIEAAARAEIERTKRTIEAAKADVAAAKAALEKARSLQAAQNSAAASAGGTVPGGTAGIMRLTGERGVNQAQNELANQQKLLDGAEARLKTLESSLVVPSAGGTGGGNSDNAKALAKHQQKLADLEKLKVGASGKQLANINKQIDREKAIIGNLQKGVGESAAIAATSGSTASHAKKRDRSEQELSRLAIEELQARLDLTNNAQDRADLQQDILAEERKQRVAEINQDEDLSAAQKKAALARITKLYGPAPTESGDIPVSPGLLQQSVTRQKEEQLAREALDAAQASNQNDQDLLRAQADLVVTRADRQNLELKLLDLAYEQERLDQQAIIDSATASDAQKKIAEQRLRILDQLKGYDAERIGRQYESPLEQRRRQVRETAANMSDAVENIELNAVDRLGDSLADATTEFLHLGGVAGDVLNSIINDFIRLAAQQAIFGSLGGGSGGGGLLGGLGKLFGIAGARAAGGPVSGGQTYLVGENGPELFRAPTSGTIVPNHQLNATAAASMTGVRAAVAGATTAVTQVLKFDLRSAVVTEDLLAEMNQMAQQAAIQGAQGGRALAARDLKAMGRPRM
jgi:tape measure domain-containing protein